MQESKAERQYDKWWDDFKTANLDEPGTAYRVELVEKAIKKIDPKNLLDTGCGSAEFLKKIAAKSKFKKISLAGFDVSKKIIERNKKKYKDVFFFCSDLNAQLIESEKKYDLVISTEVIEHLTDWKHSLKGIAGMVKSGGSLVITTQAGKIYQHHKDLGHLKHFKKNEITKELVKNNFEIIESRYCGWPFMNLKNILVNIFYGTVEDGMMKAKKQSTMNKIIFKIFGILYKISSKRKGPQIFIIGRKIVKP